MLGGRLDESYDADVRSSMTLLTLGKISANSVYRFVAPFIATIASGIGVSISTIGAAIAISEAVGLTSPYIARVLARRRRRSAMVAGLLTMALGTGITATSTTAVQFAIGITIAGTAKIVFDLGVIGWITDRVEYARVGRVIGLTETAWAMGLFTGVVLMGLLTGVTSWRWGYVLGIVGVVTMAAVLRARLPDEPAPAATPTAAPHTQAGRGQRLGAAMWIVAGSMLLTGAAQCLFVTFGKWLQDEFGFSDTQLAVVIFGFGGVELLASAGSANLADRWGKQRAVLVGAGAMVPAGVALSLLHDHLTPGLVLLAIYMTGFEFAVVSTLSLANGLVPDNPAKGLGATLSGMTLGRGVFAPIATAAFTAHGMWLPVAIGATCVSGTIGCHLRHRSTSAHALATAA